MDDQVTGKTFWLKVEIANINFHRSGHIYLELAEIQDEKVIAKCRGMIWGIKGSVIKESLGKNYQSVLSKGNEILCLAEINYKIQYGLSINILDVNVEFAVGQIEKRRQETIDRLKKEGLLNLNKERPVPMVVKTIGLLASKNTSGYQDFISNLTENQYGYVFNIELYSSAVQGNAAAKGIVTNLKKADEEAYDCVVIIRGGGSKMDLDVFNAYEISKQVSQMKTPVFSGIGHETDVTVLDFVVNKALKTPTEVSNHILTKSYEFEQKILRAYALIQESYGKIVERRRSELVFFSEGIVNSSNGFTQLRRGTLHTIMNRLTADVNGMINEEKNRLSLAGQKVLQLGEANIRNQEELMEKNKELLVLFINNVINLRKTYLNNALIITSSSSPKTILKKGFVIPRVDGEL